jgi:acyl-CoA thioester hydrolase
VNERPAWSPQPYRTPLREDWIDYNGHLRDAFYTLVASNGIDDLMEQAGLDAAYRAATGGTLYTLEMHVHFIQEMKRGDELTVLARPLGVDAKRLHLRCDILCPRLVGPAAVVEVLLLHVQQHPAPKAAPFPDAVSERLRSWLAASRPPEVTHVSRAIGLQQRSGVT